MDMNLDQYLERFESISEAASKEYSLEKAMEKMHSEWDDVSLLKLYQCSDVHCTTPRFDAICQWL